jgi:lipoprotein-anchoring transpeptidase ErfK/SrfK
LHLFHPAAKRRTTPAIIATFVAVSAALIVPAAASAATLKIGSSGPSVVALQQQLISLGYMKPVRPTGYFGPQTEQAVMALQGWEGVTRDGVFGPATSAQLSTARRPIPWSTATRHIEVHKARQVALLVRDGYAVRTIHVSTGRAGHDTPSGKFAIYRRELRSWSYQYHVWLPQASYFTGGYAFHQYALVPGYAASHGCVRVAPGYSDTVWGFARMGTPVVVG